MHRDERVAQAVLDHDGALRQALGAGRLDEVGREHLDHGAPGHPRRERDHAQREGHGRQQQVARLVQEVGPATPERGQHAQADREHEHAQDGREVDGGADRDQREQGSRVVAASVPPVRLVGAQGDGHGHGQEHREQDELEGHRQASQDQVADILLELVALAQVALDAPGRPTPGIA